VIQIIIVMVVSWGKTDYKVKKCISIVLFMTNRYGTEYELPLQDSNMQAREQTQVLHSNYTACLQHVRKTLTATVLLTFLASSYLMK
jgi:hypothetical protein